MTDRWALAPAEDGGVEIAPLGPDGLLAGPVLWEPDLATAVRGRHEVTRWVWRSTAEVYPREGRLYIGPAVAAGWPAAASMAKRRPGPLLAPAHQLAEGAGVDGEPALGHLMAGRVDGDSGSPLPPCGGSPAATRHSTRRPRRPYRAIGPLVTRAASRLVALPCLGPETPAGY